MNNGRDVLIVPNGHFWRLHLQWVFFWSFVVNETNTFSVDDCVLLKPVLGEVRDFERFDTVYNLHIIVFIDLKGSPFFRVFMEIWNKLKGVFYRAFTNIFGSFHQTLD
jgi:hypothetical protein